MRYLPALILFVVASFPLVANAQSFPLDGAYAGSASIKCSGSCAGIGGATPINFRLRRAGNTLSFRAYASSFPLTPYQGGFIGRAPGFTSGVTTEAACSAASAVAIAPARGGRLQYAAKIVIRCSDGESTDLILSGQVRRAGN